MKKLVLIFLTALTSNLFGQAKYFTKSGKVYFNATASAEKIDATNEKATSILDVSNGAIEFALLMKAFTFERALMQEHFNENYVESDKFPKAVFKGLILNMSSVDLKKDGDYPVKIKGTMTMHGETKEVLSDGTLSVKDGNVTAGKSKFKITLADYKIDIPSLVKDKIASDVDIDVDVNYELFKTS